MLFRSSAADENYLRAELPAFAEKVMPQSAQSTEMGRLRRASAAAADAYGGFRSFILERFFERTNPSADYVVRAAYRTDRFAMGATEYDWALQNNLRIHESAAQLYERANRAVGKTHDAMVSLARTIARSHGWPESKDDATTVREVFNELSKDAPRTDRELLKWYQAEGARLVAYARNTHLFHVPEDYRLDVTLTPPQLRSSVDDAAYYPAAPFKGTGVGRFYVTGADDDEAKLKEAHYRAAVAVLAAHEGFPEIGRASCRERV